MGKTVAVCVTGHALLCCCAVTTTSKLKYSLLEEAGLRRWRYLQQGSGCSESIKTPKAPSDAIEAADTC